MVVAPNWAKKLIARDAPNKISLNPISSGEKILEKDTAD